MIATIILSILALCYYLFSIFFITVLIEEDLFEKSTSARLGALIGIFLIAPIATPIGRHLGLVCPEYFELLRQARK